MIKNAVKDKSLLAYFQWIWLFLRYMIKSYYNVIGVMSGTSLDGIDLAHVSFEIGEVWRFNIGAAQTVPYPSKWKQKLTNLIKFDGNTLEGIDNEYTLYLAEVIRSFIKKYHLETIDAVCSHGHTALHQPSQKLTYQIGNLPILSEQIGCTVVCDFRVQDVKLNGQGAPLVPVGDRYLFSEYDFCVNLGGFANISSEFQGQRVAYDICPVNIVMNRFAERLGFDYDKDGGIAKSGHIDRRLLQYWNDLEYYKLSAPKSLGVEWVETEVISVLSTFDISISDILRTFVEHIAIQIASAFNKNSKVLCTGGGTFNTFLLERIRAQKDVNLIVPNKQIIEYKEALIFGFLGVLKLRNEVNCLASVTGANYNHSSGEIYYP